jgi:hypothetical protein
MMSLEVLEAVNNEIARQAAREGLIPYIPASADEAVTPFFCPNIGSLKPRGWIKTGQTWFVDKTGNGETWELALTWQQFRRQLAGYLLRHPGHGFAITEEGECQVVISAFRQIGKAV